MPDIFMVEPGHPATFIFGAEVLLVPFNDHLSSVRIVHGNKKKDNVIQNLFCPLIVFRGEVIGQLHGHLTGANLGGVEGAVDHHDGFSRIDDFVRFFVCYLSGVSQHLLILPVFL